MDIPVIRWEPNCLISVAYTHLVISAMQKCIRRAEEDTALRMAYELYITSTFHEEKMWNRLLVISVEDVLSLIHISISFKSILL